MCVRMCKVYRAGEDVKYKAENKHTDIYAARIQLFDAKFNTRRV